MTAAGRRQFMLVDPCLMAAGSHPLHYAAEVLAAARRAGCDCRLLGNRACAAGLRAADCPVRPTFTNSGYSKYTIAGGLDRLDGRGRSGWLPRPLWESRHGARRREERIATFARDLAPALAELRSGDVVLLATASELEIAGLARAIAGARPAPGIGWHALVHFPVYRGFVADYDRQDSRLQWARDLLRAARALVPELQLHATTEELAAQHARLVGGPVGVLPYPIQSALVGAGGDHRHRGGLRVSCLGDARPEKGSQALPAIVSAALADPLLAGVRFAVQTNLGFDVRSRAAEHRAVSRALATLTRQAAAGGPVDLLPGPLDAAAYARALAATDIMLLPYDQERYRVRCSGIVLESLASGVVPIVTGGGWMARQFAEPLRRHAAAAAARAEVLDERLIAGPRLGGGRSLAIDMSAAAPRAADAGRQEIIAVAIHWRPGAGSEEPPVRVAVASSDRLPATMLAADGSGEAACAIFPRAAPPRALCRVEVGGGSAAVEAIVVRRLAAAGPVPAGAVGAVIAAADDAAAALSEVVRHFPHYRESAMRHAATVRAAASGDAVVRRLRP